jgi:hypothetical protein
MPIKVVRRWHKKMDTCTYPFLLCQLADAIVQVAEIIGQLV